MEIGDWHRFTGGSIGAYLGLVPTESLLRCATLAGLDHQDREHPRPPAAGRGGLAPPQGRTAPGLTMQARWDQAPAAARARGHEGNHRLHHRWEVFTARNKRPVIANVAIARELAGWCWSLAVLDD